MSSCPEAVKCYISTLKILRNNCEAKSYTCKSCILREWPEFDCTCSCTFTLIYCMRNIWFWNVCFICCIIDNNSANLISVINPLLKLVLSDCWTCWIVREAEIYDIWCFFWKFWCKVSLCCTRHINNITPCLLLWNIISCSSCHCISINIYRIYRVTYCNLIIYWEDISYITWIRLCSIWYEYLICWYITSTLLVIMVCNCTS